MDGGFVRPSSPRVNLINPPPPCNPPLQELKDLFDELDKDHNGHVSVDELRESIRSIGIDLSEVDGHCLLVASLRLCALTNTNPLPPVGASGGNDTQDRPGMHSSPPLPIALAFENLLLLSKLTHSHFPLPPPPSPRASRD